MLRHNRDLVCKLAKLHAIGLLVQAKVHLRCLHYRVSAKNVIFQNFAYIQKMGCRCYATIGTWSDLMSAGLASADLIQLILIQQILIQLISVQLISVQLILIQLILIRLILIQLILSQLIQC